MKRSKWLPASLAFVALVFPRAETFGQAVYGSIVGTVTDASGSVVPNAKVTIINVGQGVSYSTTTNTSGNYEQTHLIVSKYQVRIEAPGFQVSVHEDTDVFVDAVTQVNAQLQIGRASESVIVTAEASLLKTTKTDVSYTIPARSLESLPILDRNVARLIFLAPGVVGTGTGASSEQPQDIFRPRVNGQFWGGVSAQLDGTDNRESVLGAMVVTPNLDALSELKYTTSAYDAEFGQANQGIVVAQTRSGTNDLHGSAFYYHRDQSTFARDPFSQSQPLPGPGNRFIPPTNWNQFGGSFGGPIHKDKTFFFMDYQGARQKDGGTVTVRVPTAAERAGDLRDLGINIFDPACTTAGTPACTSPGARKQFMGNNGTTPNVIPTAQLSPQAQYLLNHFVPYPGEANVPAGVTPCAPLTVIKATDNNCAFSGFGITNSDAFDVRVDHYLTAKLHMFGRYSLQQFQQAAPGAFGAESGGPRFTGFAGTSDLRNQSLAYGLDVALRPNLLGDFRFGFFRARVLVNPNGLGTQPATDAGIPGLNTGSTFASGMPAFQLFGIGGFGFGYSLDHGTPQGQFNLANCNCPLDEQQNEFQWVTNWTYIRGNHSIKFGVDVRHHQNLRVPSDNHRAGELQFIQATTSGGSGANTGAGLPLATFLIGDVSSFARYVSNVTNAAERQNRLFSYAQDTWRLTSKLTLNYGLRWEIYFPQYVNAKDEGGFIGPNSAEVLVAGENGVSLSGNVSTNLKYIAPRVGIAYQVQQRTVIRLGYGRSFDVGIFGTSFGHNVTQNLPVLANQVISPLSGSSDVFNLALGPPAVTPAGLLAAQPTAPDGNHLLPNVANNPTLPRGVAEVSPKILPLNSDGTMRLPTVDSWNVTLEHQFGSSLVASVGYVGNKGTHVFPNTQAPDANQIGLVVGSNRFNGRGSPQDPRKRLFAKFGWTQATNYYSDDANNHYNALQAQVQKRFSNGLSFQGNYTYASAFDYTNDYYFWDPRQDYGFEDGLRRNVFTAINLYELPFGRGRKFLSNAARPVDLLLGGWQISGNWVWESGVPFTPSYTNCNNDRDTGPCKPNIVGPVQTGLGRNQWFTVASSTLTNPALSAANPCPGSVGTTSGPWQEPACGTFGNVARNSLFGPHLFNADLSLGKSFVITERLKAEFRAESFNAFNHVNLGQPVGNVDATNAGRITSLAGLTTMRRWQFGLRLQF
jgi:hypothetical protein